MGAWAAGLPSPLAATEASGVCPQSYGVQRTIRPLISLVRELPGVLSRPGASWAGTMGFLRTGR